MLSKVRQMRTWQLKGVPDNADNHEAVRQILWPDLTAGERAQFSAAMEATQKGPTSEAFNFIPGVGFARAGLNLKNPKGPGGVHPTPGEQKGFAIEAGMLAAEAIPIGKVASTMLKGTRAVMSTKLGGGFTTSTTPGTHVPKLMGGAYDAELLKQSIDLRKQIAETGSGQVTIGGKTYTVNQTRLDQAIRNVNPGATLTTTGSPDVSAFQQGGTVPVMVKPSGQIKIPEEQFQFRTPGGTGVMKFADQSAFGHKSTPNAGLAVYADTVDDLAIPGSSSSPLGVKHYSGSRELEFGAATGTEISAVRPTTGVGLEGKTLYLAEDLAEPSYVSRVKANLQAAGDELGRRRKGGLQGETATADDIAQSRFGKELDNLTPDEAKYVQQAQQTDEVLQTAAAQGDETAQEILTSRQPFDDAIKRTEFERLEDGMAGRTDGRTVRPVGEYREVPRRLTDAPRRLTNSPNLTNG